jgi:hypothetical protein
MAAPTATQLSPRAPRAQSGRETMLLDGLLPDFHATRIEHRVIACDLPEAYEARRQADFMRAWRDSAAVRVLFGLRGAGERARRSRAGNGR